MNMRLLLVYQALYLVNEAILLIKLAQNNAPSPNEALELADDLSDLEMTKFELDAQRIQLENDSAALPPPAADATNAVSALLVQVEAARQAGATAVARMAVAQQVLAMAITLLS